MNEKALLSILADQGSRPSITRRVMWSDLVVRSSVIALASYRVIVWACWLPNMIVAELFIGAADA